MNNVMCEEASHAGDAQCFSCGCWASITSRLAAAAANVLAGDFCTALQPARIMVHTQLLLEQQR
jgi:hypothetical protein